MITDLTSIPRQDLIAALWQQQYAREPTRIRFPAEILPALQTYAENKTESFFTCTLNGAHELIEVREATRGLVNRTVAHPREVFRGAILDNAVAVILAHNHPSGNLDPSKEDDDITKRLVDAGQVVGIRVLDHVIFSPFGYYSYLEHDRL